MTKNYVLKPIYNDKNECINDTLSADNSGNRDDVEDEGPMLEVTPALKVTPVLTRRAKEKIDIISVTWVPEST